MLKPDPRRAMQKLDGVLDREKQALSSGDLDSLTGLLREKEALLPAFEGVSADVLPGLVVLKEKVDRNQALLGGALEAVRDVADRINMLRRAHRSLETYDDSGKRSTILTQNGQRMEKRA